MNATTRDREFQALWDEAISAGKAAAQVCTPTPMTFAGRALDEPPKAYYEADGAAGIAWVIVEPGTCSFARWARKQGLMKSSRAWRGVNCCPPCPSQSIERYEAGARAMRDVFARAGLCSHVTSMLD